jgi:purine-binding chemotaxis protein CheW
MSGDIAVMNQAPKIVPEKEGKYLTFILAEEEYGIGLLKIKEIIGVKNITMIPKSPAYVKGVINLRGKVIPVIDLRIKFGLVAREYMNRTCIIIVEMAKAARKVMIGIIVDSVSEILKIKAVEIEDAPNFGNHWEMGYILGIAKIGGNVKILLDIDKVFRNDEVVTMEC